VRSRLVTAVALASLTAVAASWAAGARAPITQAASGKTIRLAKGESATLRLANRWDWSEPRVSTAAVELTPVEYFVDPGFREWTIDARKPGRATIRSRGTPKCSGCSTRRFSLTVVVTAP
jgi:predicted secreted protein